MKKFEMIKKVTVVKEWLAKDEVSKVLKLIKNILLFAQCLMQLEKIVKTMIELLEAFNSMS